jgi:DNA-binding XRE family transcriptional regulator
MESLAERLKYARLRSRMSQTELARLSGVSQTTIASIETGRANASRHIVPIAKALAVSINWLATGSEDGHGPVDLGPPLDPETTPAWSFDDTGMGRGYVRLWLDLHEYSLKPDHAIAWKIARKQALLVDREALERNYTHPDNCRLIFHRGNSMEPYLFDGDFVLIDTEKTQPKEGKVFLFDFQGEPLMAQVFKQPGGGLVLHSFNSSFPDKTLAAEHIESLTVIGQCTYRAGSGIAS